MQHGIGTTHHATVDFIHSQLIAESSTHILFYYFIFIIYIRQAQQTEDFYWVP